jgi:hypothetical protein
VRAIYLLGLALGSFVCVPRPAVAAVESVTVSKSRNYEKAKGYTYAEITITGSVARDDGTVGKYSVPATYVYPKHGRGNGVGVVDWLNSAFYHFFPPATEDGTLEFTLLATESYLFDEGYTYLTIQWNKAVTEIFGATIPDDGKKHNRLVFGSIERGADAWEILLDAARLLKNPRAYPGRNGPSRVSTVLSSGYSQGAGLQLELLAERLDPKRVYDGHLIQNMGLACWKRNDEPPYYGGIGDCSPLPTKGNHAPVIVLQSESDMVAFGPAVLQLGKSAFFTRNPRNPNWRQYEISGVSHIPTPVFALADVKNQNSGDPRPVFRAAFENLTTWVRCGFRKPPASRYLQGDVDANDVFVPAKDDDGHFAGGVRLPHVAVPLGNHAPLNDAGLDPFNVFTLLGGTFQRFGNLELLARYPTHSGYVRRVRRAADELAAKDYITHKDRKALIAAAEAEPLYDP